VTMKHKTPKERKKKVEEKAARRTPTAENKGKKKKENFFSYLELQKKQPRIKNRLVYLLMDLTVCLPISMYKIIFLQWNGKLHRRHSLSHQTSSHFLTSRKEPLAFYHISS
jgi:hypothetical protein